MTFRIIMVIDCVVIDIEGGGAKRPPLFLLHLFLVWKVDSLSHLNWLLVC